MRGEAFLIRSPRTGGARQQMHRSTLALPALPVLVALAALAPAAAFVPSLPMPPGVAMGPMRMGLSPASFEPARNSHSALRLNLDDMKRRSFIAGLISTPLLIADRVAAQDPPKPQFAPLVPEGYTGTLPNPKMEPVGVIKELLKGLSKVDEPVQNHGLFTVLAYATLKMPFALMPIEEFRAIMDKSAYRLLFNGYETSEVIPQTQFEEADKEIWIVDTKLYASRDKLAELKVKPEMIATKNGKTFANMRWELRRNKGAEGDSWRFNTVYFFQTVEMMELQG